MRLLAQNPLRYRRQILALKQFFIGRECTVLLLDDQTSEAEDLQLQSIAHGVISLEQLSPEYGAERRRLRVTKFRGQKYRGGYHDFVIDRGRARRLPPARRGGARPAARRAACSRAGIAELDALLGGGLALRHERAPARPGRERQIVARHPVRHGPRRVAATAPPSSPSTRASRPCSSGRPGLGMDLTEHLESGRIAIQQVDPAELSPGEFAHLVRQAVEGEGGRPGAKVVVIDSLNGYLNAMPEERFLTIQLHELLTYLGHKGVVTFLIVAQHGMLGRRCRRPVDTSYLADSVILFRYFEATGEVRQAISVVKKRSGRHERTIREFWMDDSGLHVGEPLRRLPRHPVRNPDLPRGRQSLSRGRR